jgi:hypothetical protein
MSDRLIERIGDETITGPPAGPEVPPVPWRSRPWAEFRDATDADDHTWLIDGLGGVLVPYAPRLLPAETRGATRGLVQPDCFRPMASLIEAALGRARGTRDTAGVAHAV